MWYLYLDESGDLGFDFDQKRPSDFFTVCILATSHRASVAGLRKAAKITLRRKVNKGGRARKFKTELKGTETTLAAKTHFYEQVRALQFGIYAITLNKRRVYDELKQKKDHVYNYVARLVLDEIPFEQASTRVQLVIDKSKSRAEIDNFDTYVVNQLKGRVQPKVLIDIDHIGSHEDGVLQAADLFTWGVSRKYQSGDCAWFDIFREKVRFENLYLK